MSTSQTPVPEDDIASTVSRDDEEEDEREGSKGDGENGEFSGEETAAAAANGSAQPPKKRKRVKYDKTSCVSLYLADSVSNPEASLRCPIN